jgi:Putative metallopeptidase family (DUF6782)
MWAEFPVHSVSATTGPKRYPPAARVLHRGTPRRGLAIWFLVLAFVLAIGSFTGPPASPNSAEPAHAGLHPRFQSAGRQPAHFRPGGVALDRIAAIPVARQPGAEGCLIADRLDDATPERAGLSRLFETLGRSPTGEALLREAASRGVRVCIDRTTDLLAYYFASMNVVGVSWGLSEGGRLIFLAHELAHIPQHPRYSDNRYFPPEDLILLRRMREAVAEATATRIAWELRTAGFAEAWEEKLATPYADVAQAFARVAEKPPQGETMAAATRAAFDQWFAASWRRDVYDRMTVAHLQRIAADSLGLVPARRAITDRFLVRIGRMGQVGGENFLAKRTSRSLTDMYYAGNVSAEIIHEFQRLGFNENPLRRSVAEGRLSDVAS